jgi:hypothetical protein
MRRDSPASASELWRRDLESGNSQAVLRGVSIVDYDLSSDGKEAVFSTQPPGKASQIWLAKLDGSSPPKLIASTGESAPRLGPEDEVVFEFSDGKANYIGRIRKHGSARSKLVSNSIADLHTISPDRRWVVAGVPAAPVAFPTREGSPRRICANECAVSWAPDGKFLYLGVERSSRTSTGKTVAIPVPPGQTFPNLPASGIRGIEDAKALPGARVLDRYDISPGLDPSVYAYTKTTVHRNLYRISVP